MRKLIVDLLLSLIKEAKTFRASFISFLDRNSTNFSDFFVLGYDWTSKPRYSSRTCASFVCWISSNFGRSNFLFLSFELELRIKFVHFSSRTNNNFRMNAIWMQSPSAYRMKCATVIADSLARQGDQTLGCTSFSYANHCWSCADNY